MANIYQATYSEIPTSSTVEAPGFVRGGVAAILRVEGLAIFVATTVLFARTQSSWWLYAALFILPDVSFLAYLVNPRVGANAYNALHTYLAPSLLGTIAYYIQIASLLPVALIWASHIGFDRAMGYGLKYDSSFGDTHLGRKSPRSN